MRPISSEGPATGPGDAAIGTHQCHKSLANDQHSPVEVISCAFCCTAALPSARKEREGA